MKKLILFCFIFQISCMNAQEQVLHADLISKNKLDADIVIGKDGLGYTYFIKSNTLFKNHKDEIWQYKNITLGNISKVDIQNPLKIVLFYADFNTIITLDNQLNETQKINFAEFEIPIFVTATGIASLNKFWIYNSLTQQIGLYDYLNNSYKTITPPINGTLKHYESNFNTFQWIDEKLNWYSCSLFGNITFMGKVPDFDEIQLISNTNLIYKKNNLIYYLNLIGNKIYLIDFDKKTFEKFNYKDQILSIFTNQEIINYKITTP